MSSNDPNSSSPTVPKGYHGEPQLTLCNSCWKPGVFVDRKGENGWAFAFDCRQEGCRYNCLWYACGVCKGGYQDTHHLERHDKRWKNHASKPSHIESAKKYAGEEVYCVQVTDAATSEATPMPGRRARRVSISPNTLPESSATTTTPATANTNAGRQEEKPRRVSVSPDPVSTPASTTAAPVSTPATTTTAISKPATSTTNAVKRRVEKSQGKERKPKRQKVIVNVPKVIQSILQRIACGDVNAATAALQDLLKLMKSHKKAVLREEYILVLHMWLAKKLKEFNSHWKFLKVALSCLAELCSLDGDTSKESKNSNNLLSKGIVECCQATLTDYRGDPLLIQKAQHVVQYITLFSDFKAIAGKGNIEQTLELLEGTPEYSWFSMQASLAAAEQWYGNLEKASTENAQVGRDQFSYCKGLVR